MIAVVLALLLAQPAPANTVSLPGKASTMVVNVQGSSSGTSVHIVCDSGCGGAASFLDSAAFTAAVTAINVSGGVFDDGLADIVSGKAAAPRITKQRALHFNMRTAAGTEVPFPAALDADLGFKVHVQNTLTVTGPLTDVQLRASAVPTTDAHTTAAAPLSLRLSDGAAFYDGTKTGQLPAALDGSGFLKVHEQGTATVSGTVAVSNSFALDATLTGGSQVAQVKSGAKGASAAALVTSTANGVDHQGLDVAVQGNATVVQPTGTNLHAVLDTTSTTAVTQATGTNLHAVLDATSTTAVTQATAANLNGTMKLIDTAGTNLGSILANDATAIANGLETQPAVARATPTAVTAGRSEKLQVNTVNGGLYVAHVGGTGTLIADVLANDATALANGLAVLPAIAKAGPATTTAARAESLQQDSVSGGLYITESPTTNNTALSSTTYTANTALNIKASAGNVYGWSAINAAAAVCWLQFYNTSGTPTCGTAVVWSIPLPVTPGTSVIISPHAIRNHATGIAICVSTTATGATTCGSVSSGTIFYK